MDQDDRDKVAYVAEVNMSLSLDGERWNRSGEYDDGAGARSAYGGMGGLRTPRRPDRQDNR